MRSSARPRGNVHKEIVLASLVIAAAFLVVATVPVPFERTAGTAAIVFSSDGGAGTAEIYRIAPDGSGLARLTANSTDERDPAVSPDGTRIAYASDASGFSQIYLMNADGTGSQRVLRSTWWDESPRWSPDGRRLVFTRLSRFADVSRIWIVNTDGTGPRELTPRGASDWDPDWSPDGARIVFAARSGAHRQIHTMRADGGDRRRVTRDASDKRNPRWSPDGRRIAYSAAGSGPASASIHVVRADGAGDVALTTGVAEDGRPAWTPDGRRIVFQSDRRGIRRICTMKPDGSDLRWVTSAACPGSGPTPSRGTPRLADLAASGGDHRSRGQELAATPRFRQILGRAQKRPGASARPASSTIRARDGRGPLRPALPRRGRG